MQLSLSLLPVAAALVDASGHLTAANSRCAAMFAPGGGGLRGAKLAGFLPLEPRALERLRDAAVGGRAARLQARRRNEVPFLVDVEVARHDDSLLCLFREVRFAARAETGADHLDRAFECSPLGMALFDTDGRYMRVNAALCGMLGRREPDLLGRRDQELTHPEDRAADVSAAWRILNGEMDVWQTRKRFVTADGGVIWTIANLSFSRDVEGRPLCWLGQFQDITPMKRYEDELAHLADHDELTGLANRRGVLGHLTLCLARSAREGERGALVLFDLNGFKAVNDTNGHDAGDRLLTAVGEALRSRLRDGDIAGRLGGDEFAVVLPQAAPVGAEAAAAALAAAIERASMGRVTASYGVALYGGAGSTSAAELFAEADSRMYRAKAEHHAGTDRRELAAVGR